MKFVAMTAVIFAGVILLFVSIRFVDDYLAPLFLNSRIERLGETKLPKIQVQSGNIIYCRMKADDFYFPLPTASLATNLVVVGSFDTVDGSVEARFDGGNFVTPREYERFISGKVQVGGQISAESNPGGLLIKFHYFGDR